jgi:hypothetical protein
MRTGAGLLVAVALGAACVSSEVTPTGPTQPARVDDCAIQVYGGPPEYPAIDIASARAECSKLAGRHKCMTELKRDACRAGADTIYGVNEIASTDYTYVTATFARRDRSVNVTRAPAPAPAPVAPPKPPEAAVAAPPPPPAPSADCVPICSPGFVCAAGQCVPQCNPACEAGETCTRKRICEPAAPSMAGRPPNAPPPTPNPAFAPAWPPPAGKPTGPPVVRRRRPTWPPETEP